MNDVITALSWVNDIVFVSLINTSLQMTILIPLVALFIWIFRAKSAATRHFLWLSVLIAIVLLPLITPFIPQMNLTQFRHQGARGYEPVNMMKLGMGDGDVAELPEASDSVPSTNTAGIASKKMDVSIVNPVSIAYFVWCAGVLFVSWVTVGVYRRLRRLRVRSTDIVDQTALDMLSRLRDRLSIRRAVALKASSEIYSPISMGIFQPTIIIPDDLIDNSSDQLGMVLTHELAHIKRYDYLISLLQNTLRAIFFFHPLFHLMNRNLAKEREHVCDDWVIDVTRHRSRYADCIIGLLEKAVHRPVNIPVTIAMAERKQDIPGRIDMIVNKGRKIATKVSKKVAIMILLIGCLVLPIIATTKVIYTAEAVMADSGDGTIVFARFSGDDSDLYTMEANGENQHILLAKSGAGMYPAWSPDGKKIAFMSMPADVGQIRVLDVAKKSAIVVASGDGDKEAGAPWSPSWSPDGRKIAFHRHFNFNNNWDISIVDADGKNEKKLTDDGDSYGPSWSPDGSKISFAKGQGGIWVMETDGRNVKKLHHGWDGAPSWSPDGSKIAFSQSVNGSGEICVMNSDGTNVKKLTNNQADDILPAWSPDGKRIAFCSDRDGDYEIYVMDNDGTSPVNLTNNPATDWTPAWTAFSYAVEPAGKLKSTWGKIKRGLFPR